MCRFVASLLAVVLAVSGCTFTGSLVASPPPSAAVPSTVPTQQPSPTPRRTPRRTPAPTPTPRPQTSKSIESLAVGTRDRSPDTTPADVRAVVRGDTDFAIDLYQRLRTRKDPNLVIGPHSISVAFAMQHVGARGRTASQLEKVLHFSLPTRRLDAAFDRLALDLASRQNRQVTLSIANRLFGDRLLGDIPVPFRQSFLRELTRSFGAPMASVDFSVRPEAVRKLINAWVADRTGGRIRDLIPKDKLRKNTVMVLVNAMYLDARWASPFLKQRTTDQRFERLDGTRVKVPTMQQERSFPVVAARDYVAVELPYRGDALSMLVVMPTPGTFARFERSLDRSVLNGVIRRLDVRTTILALPRFDIQTRLDLAKTFAAMGMPEAFDEMRADFTGMTTADPKDVRLYIANVFHQAFITVAEKGTVAGAATAIVDEGATGGMEGAVEARIDHPFLWFIRDRATGAILFMGRVTDPSVMGG
jgi:serpin B